MSDEPPALPAPPRRAGTAVALLVVFDAATLGFVTLGFEMVASRILTPLFGSGIYTWATIISIVVAGLMAGYFLGGFLADRFPGFGFAALIKLLAAAWLVLVFALTAGSLEAMIGGIDDETTALFASGIVICFPPLVVLGMYSPLSVRLLLRDPAAAGKVSGGLFAVSSLGNIVGIIVTTFVLIPAVGTRGITLGFATFLALSALLSLGARLYRR
ncbi:MAG: fused MFS/spermidine synthase [Rhizobiales bacterium]|nr:fused MFS/spermidine synthase [Hyphomicrobiales bacterium]